MNFASSQVVVHLVARRARLCFFFSRPDLVQQPAPAMAGIADAPRDAREPDFQGGAERIREDDRRFEAPAQAARDGEGRLVRRDGDHLIDLGRRCARSPRAWPA